MRTRLGILAVAGAALALVLAVAYLLRTPHQEPEPVPRETADATPSPSPSSDPSGASAPFSSATPRSSDPALASIEDMLASLLSGRATDADLAALREHLLGMNPQQAAAAIRAFLESGRDAATTQEFTVGPGGTLAGAPTLRTFLLDVLGEIGRKTKSGVALQMSREILQEKKSPDEWAVAMRNVGWADPAAKPYLAGKMREMLSHEPWLAEPSDGFLEAFDVIAFSGDPAFVPQLERLLGSGDDALSRAAAVALDRLSEMEPLDVMNHLNANPAEFAERPFLRADFFAKADVSNPAQRAALETYLSRPDVKLPEKEKLLQALAIPASFVSDNLLTPPPSVEVEDGGKRDQQLAAVFAQWQSQNRFPQLRQQIAGAQARLGR